MSGPARPPGRVAGRAYARAGLLGNPSDVYEGKAIALSICDFEASVTLEPAARFEIARGTDDALDFDAFPGLIDALDERGFYDGVRLLRAACWRFSRHAPEVLELAADDPRLHFRVSYTTTIPRQVGLAGSSAIVIAALRALAQWFGVKLPPDELAGLALAAELEDLGITAGPMDRVIQAHEGVMHMDFAPPPTYTRLDPELLPPLFLAWDPRVGQSSGRVHGDVRRRWLAGDPEVRHAIATFPKLVDRGLACLSRGDLRGFGRVVDENFDTRASIWTLGERDRELVAIGRGAGAAVKFAGSGGAVIGVLEDDAAFGRLAAAYDEAGYEAIRPALLPPGPA